MKIPEDYVQRVYAGVLGKIIGVYLGRPFEGWSNERIEKELGEIMYYVHEKRGLPLIVTDDDISGTFTFIRAFEDYGFTPDLAPAQVGQTWLNYLIEKRTVLWWGGLGNSTEHTAYLRLKSGIKAPESGSIKCNGKVVAEQIGAQIFIDGYAMVAPGDPERAAHYAKIAGSVSHDGEAIYGAQVLAAMEAAAFVESDLTKLLDTAVGLIPHDSIIYRMIEEIRGFHAKEKDWRKGRQFLEANYGYDKYGGNCHMVPNHGLIILSLLYGDDDFQKSLMIVNTSGWDTDCNSGNVGCLMGIKKGLAGIESGPDWRTPVADRLYLPTADGGSAIADAATVAYRIAGTGMKLAGSNLDPPKRGARYHFEFPGSVQGFLADTSPECSQAVKVENVEGRSTLGTRSLRISYEHLAPQVPVRVGRATFIRPEEVREKGYTMVASPTLYSGQRLEALLRADEATRTGVTAGLYIKHYVEGDQIVITRGPSESLESGKELSLSWKVPDTGSWPILEVGVELESVDAAAGSVYLHYLTWEGVPTLHLTKPAGEGSMWRRAWVDGVDHLMTYREPFRLVHNEGTGLLMQGERSWHDYRVGAQLSVHMAKAGGIVVRAQGMRRYYALVLHSPGSVRLIKSLDGEKSLAEGALDWKEDETILLELEARGVKLTAFANGKRLFDVEDTDQPFTGGAAGLICTEGRMSCDFVDVAPVAN